MVSLQLPKVCEELGRAGGWLRRNSRLGWTGTKGLREPWDWQALELCREPLSTGASVARKKGMGGKGKKATWEQEDSLSRGVRSCRRHPGPGRHLAGECGNTAEAEGRETPKELAAGGGVQVGTV